MNADSDDDLAIVKWCMREAFRQNQGRIIAWLSEGAPARISIRCRLNVPIGIYLTGEMA